jgi:hypothetical protein
MRHASKGILVCALLAACDEPVAREGKIDESLSAIYAEVFVPAGCTGCHDAEAPGGLDLSTVEAAYASLVGMPAEGKRCAPVGSVRVVPENASVSLLVHKLEGHDETDAPVCGKPMPQETRLGRREIDAVRAWIDRGAHND